MLLYDVIEILKSNLNRFSKRFLSYNLCLTLPYLIYSRVHKIGKFHEQLNYEIHPIIFVSSPFKNPKSDDFYLLRSLFYPFVTFSFDNQRKNHPVYTLPRLLKFTISVVILKNFFSIRLINFLKCKRFVSYIFIIVSPFFSLHNKNLYPIILIYSLRTYKFPVILYTHFSNFVISLPLSTISFLVTMILY